MSKFERRYSEDQIDACVHAYMDRGIRPKRVVIAQAAAGQLLARDGRTLKPFEMNPASFNGYISLERRRRRGPKFGSGLDALDRPDDVMEGMRRRMIAVANDELTHAEKQRKGKRDPEHLRQIARLMREVAALPGPKESRSRAPGNGPMAERKEGESRHGLAGAMLHAHRTQTAPKPLSKQETTAETTNTSATTRSDEHEPDETASESGSDNRESITPHSAQRLVAAAMVRSLPSASV